jgi:RhtB (resistance to homoserine/threonine) family protein
MITDPQLLSILAIAAIHLAAVASPGPDFALIVKNSIGQGRKAGLSSALGIAIAAGLHVVFVLTGISLLVSNFPPAFLAIQYGGAAYLLYIGFKSLKAKKHTQPLNITNTAAETKHIRFTAYFMQGFVTNLLNPKAWIYFTAIFSQFVSINTPINMLCAYWSVMMIIQLGWFSGLTLFLTHNTIRARFMAISHWIERICGGLLMALGIKLALSKLN